MDQRRYQTYRNQLAADLAAIDAQLAVAGFDTPVPSCPGWTVDDLAHHLGDGYQHKTTAIRTGEDPRVWPPEPTDGSWQAPVREFLAVSGEQLLREFAARDPDQPCWTWDAEDQTVGFWARRMAQETVIHRWDLESAVSAPTSINADMAADGIDEMLVAFLPGDWSDDPQDGPTGAVDITTDHDRWRIVLGPDEIQVLRDQAQSAIPPAADAEIRGTAEDLLLGLWGRCPMPAATGSAAVASALQERLTLVSQ